MELYSSNDIKISDIIKAKTEDENHWTDKLFHNNDWIRATITILMNEYNAQKEHCITKNMINNYLKKKLLDKIFDEDKLLKKYLEAEAEKMSKLKEDISKIKKDKEQEKLKEKKKELKEKTKKLKEKYKSVKSIIEDFNKGEKYNKYTLVAGLEKIINDSNNLDVFLEEIFYHKKSTNIEKFKKDYPNIDISLVKDVLSEVKVFKKKTKENGEEKEIKIDVSEDPLEWITDFSYNGVDSESEIGRFMIPKETSICTDIINKALDDNQKEEFLIRSCCAAGRFADIPHIDVIKKAIEKETSKKQPTIYVVYLMKKDGSSVYLTLNQMVEEKKGKNTSDDLKSQANEISDIISKSAEFGKIVKERKFVYNDKAQISLSNDDKNELSQTTKKYIKATILYKEYKKGQVPSEAELEEDLKRMMEIYEYVLSSYSPNSNSVDGKTVKAVFDESKNRIFYGPPGTGKTKKALETAYKLIGSNGDKSKQIKLIQFHPGYHYSDFVEALDINGKCAPRIFKEFANEAGKEPEKNYVLIIDEINRANVSEVFGELLYGLEYRNVEFSTEMSKESFSVPDNLYVIGTMNTADRSLQNMDYAVRRRFSFEHIKAEAPQDKTMKSIFDKVHKDIVQSVARGVDPEDIMPGISYFLLNKEKGTREEKIEYKIKYELIPLLKEYAKDGMLTKMVKLENDKSLVELLKNSGADYSDILIEMALDSEAENNKGADK